MTDINLRNWREEKRKKRTRTFYELNMFISSLVVLSLILINVVITALHSQQKEINDYLKSEDAVLNVKLEQIGNYERQLEEISARMKIIASLQSERVNVTEIFDEVAKKTPKEIKLTALNRLANEIEVSGVSVSQLTISNYLKNLDDSKKINSARLDRVIADKKVDGFDRSKFFIKATMEKATERNESKNRE